MRYILIINSRNSETNLKRLENAIVRVNKVNPDLKSRIELRYTDYPGHAADIALAAEEKFRGKVAVVACGGDGTVHEVSNALAFRKTPVIPLPFGTGNDFVKTVLPSWKKWSIEDYLLSLDRVSYRPIDLIKADSFDIMGSFTPAWSSYFINVASIGLDTRVQSDAKALVAAHNTSHTRRTAYIRSAVKDLFGNRANRFTYTLELEDGSRISGDSDTYTLISICNGRYYGDGFTPAPDASVEDGIAQVCVVDDVSTGRALSLIARYRFGKHVGRGGIHYYRATSGVITTGEPSLMLFGNYDGEDFYGHKLRFEVAPKSLILGFWE